MPSFRELRIRPAITNTSNLSFSGAAQSDIYISFDRSSSIVYNPDTETYDAFEQFTDMIIAIKQLVINLQQFIESGDIRIGLTSFADYNANSGIPQHIVHFDLSDDYDFMINFLDDLSTQTTLANGGTTISPGAAIAYACSALHPESSSPGTGKARDNVDPALILVTDGAFTLGEPDNLPNIYPFQVANDARLGQNNSSTSDLWSEIQYGGFNFPGGSPNNIPFIQLKILGILINSNPVIEPIAIVAGAAGQFTSAFVGTPPGENEFWWVGETWGDFYEIANQIANGLAPAIIPNLQEASYTSQSLANTSYINPPTIDYSGRGVNDVGYQYHIFHPEGVVIGNAVYLSLDLNKNSFLNEVRGGSSYTHVKVKGVITNAYQLSTDPSNPAATFNSHHFEHLLFLGPY